MINPTPFVLAEDVPPREWLYGNDYIRHYVSITAAEGGVGKTSLVYAEALAMTSGRPLLGINPVGDPLRVWILNLEDPHEELQRRIHAVMQRYDVRDEELGGRLFADSGDLVVAKQSPGGGAELCAGVLDGLAEGIHERGIDVVIVDPFVSSHRCVENDNGAIDAVVKAWTWVAREGNCSVMLLHHLRKNDGKGAGVRDIRGAGSAVAAARCVRVTEQFEVLFLG